MCGKKIARGRGEREKKNQRTSCHGIDFQGPKQGGMTNKCRGWAIDGVILTP